MRNNWLVLFLNFSESAECDIIELMYTIEIPTDAYQYPHCQYKYCVISDAVKVYMVTSYEFIMGNTRDGSIIDRLLSLDTKFIKKGSK